MKEKKENADMDYEEIIIYPKDYDIKIRKKLLNALKKLGVRFEYEYYS